MASPAKPRILITRLSAIGDCILTAPVACALRDQFPDAYLAWITEPAAASLLQGHAAIDEWIVVPKGWLKSPATVLAIRRRLRSLRFDITIDPQSLSKSSILAWLSAAPRRIGLAAPFGREASRFLNNLRVTVQHPHVVDFQLELLKPLGIEHPAVRFEIPRNADAEQRTLSWIEQQALSRFAVINPGAGWDSRLWPVDRFAAVARHLGDRHGLRTVVVWSGERERGWAEAIVAQSREVSCLAPPTTLPDLASTLRCASLFVGSDTGPLHLAVAVGTPSVSIHGPTRPEQSGPYGSGNRAVQAYYQSGTSRQRRSAGNDAMLAVFSEDVCQACDDVLCHNEKPNLRLAC